MYMYEIDDILLHVSIVSIAKIEAIMNLCF